MNLSSIVDKGKKLHKKFKENMKSVQKDNKKVFEIPEIKEEEGSIFKRDNEVKVSISSWSVAKATLTIVWILALVYFIFSIWKLLFLFFIALFFAATLDPAVDFFERFRISRVFSVMLLYFLIVLFFIFFIGSLVPIMIDQISKIVTNIWTGSLEFFIKLQSWQIEIPYVWESVNTWVLTTFQSINIDQLAQQLLDNFSTYVEELQSIAKWWIVAASEVVNASAWILWAISSFLFSLTLVLFFTFFMVTDRESLNSFFRSLFPPKYSKYIEKKIHWVQIQIWAWVRGQFALMLIMFLISLIWLMIIWMGDYAITLAMIVWVWELLPYVWPLIFLLVALPIALNISFFVVVKLLILYALLQFIEWNLLVPAIMQKAVWLSPIVVLMVIIIWFQFLWVLSAIIAVPVATAVSLFIKDYILFQQNKKK